MNGCSVSMESYLQRVSRGDETASFQGTKKGKKDKRQTYPERIPQLLLFLILIRGGGFIRTYVAHDFHELFEADISIPWNNEKNQKKRNVSCTLLYSVFGWIFLFFFVFFFSSSHIIQQDGCHLSRNAIHPESPLFSRFPRFYYSFFLFLTNNTLYILYTVHFFINTSTLFLLYLDKNLPFYSKERFYYSLSPFLFYFAGAIRKTTCFLSGKRVERVMMREHKPRYRRD